MQKIANRSPGTDSIGAKLSTAAASDAARSWKESGVAESRRLHASILVVLTFLFVFRVFAQLIQAELDLPFLPEFQSWDSGVLPYAVLVIAQGMIIGTMIAVAWRVWTNRLSSTPWRQRLCLSFGMIYFSVMFIRLVVGLTVLDRVAWFSKPLPTFFHLVLASFILVLGHYLLIIERRRQGPSAPQPGRSQRTPG